MSRPLLAVRRITRDELDALLLRDQLRRRAEAGSALALTSLMSGWPEYARKIVASVLADKERSR